MMDKDDMKYELRIAKDNWGFDQDQLNSMEDMMIEKYIGQKRTFWWWLRSPGSHIITAAYVTQGGFIDDYGTSVNGHNGDGSSGVRPAMWVKSQF